jgi:hypothetical protein
MEPRPGEQRPRLSFVLLVVEGSHRGLLGALVGAAFRAFHGTSSMWDAQNAAGNGNLECINREFALSSPSQIAGRPAKTTGLGYWMHQVLKEGQHVSADFSADAVHDLRVALRRCRSMADGLRALDPIPEWKAMKKAGRQLFQRLGALRDVQVMMEWIEELEPAEANVQGAA